METISTVLMFNHWTWLSAAVILIILEMLIGANFFLLWLGITAFGVGILSWIFTTINPEFQILIFAVVSIVTLFLWGMYIKKHPTKTNHKSLNRRNEQFIGRIFTLDEPIINGRGKIKAGDTIWSVEGPDLPKGAKVKVVGANGVTLRVESFNNGIF